ncbi:amidoligase [Apiospora arundinis]|uniref:Amidoligase n=1 Tax=Apiospora arundinis TaxID=335852 RepID=A0ABR2JB63_9PEZI
MNQNRDTLFQQQAQRGLAYSFDPTWLANPFAWKFGVEIKGILFMRVQQPGEDIDRLRDQNPGVLVLPHEMRDGDYGDLGREDIAYQLEHAGVRMNRWAEDGTLLVPHPGRDPNNEELVPVDEARRLGLPNVEYRRWTITDNPSVGINLGDIQKYPRIGGYHAFGFELKSPILHNTREGIQELQRVIELLYRNEVYFNSTGGIDVHVGLDHYMIPLEMTKRIACVCLAADAALNTYHYEWEQDNSERLNIRTSSNLVHGLTAQQAAATNKDQLDGTVDWARRVPPRLRLDECINVVVDAGSYDTLDKLMSVDRGTWPANHVFPRYEVGRLNQFRRPTTTVEFTQFSANITHADEVLAWVKICLRLCSFACGTDVGGFSTMVEWCHRFENGELGAAGTWQNLLRGLGGLEDVIDFYNRDWSMLRRPTAAEEARQRLRDVWVERDGSKPVTPPNPSFWRFWGYDSNGNPVTDPNANNGGEQQQPQPPVPPPHVELPNNGEQPQPPVPPPHVELPNNGQQPQSGPLPPRPRPKGPRPNPQKKRNWPSQFIPSLDPINEGSSEGSQASTLSSSSSSVIWSVSEEAEDPLPPPPVPPHDPATLTSRQGTGTSLADYMQGMSNRNARRSPRTNRDRGGASMSALRRLLGMPPRGSGNGRAASNSTAGTTGTTIITRNPNAAGGAGGAGGANTIYSGGGAGIGVTLGGNGRSGDASLLTPRPRLLPIQTDATITRAVTIPNMLPLFLPTGASLENLPAALAAEMQRPLSGSGLTPSASPVVLADTGRDRRTIYNCNRWDRDPTRTAADGGSPTFPQEVRSRRENRRRGSQGLGEMPVSNPFAAFRSKR